MIEFVSTNLKINVELYYVSRTNYTEFFFIYHYCCYILQFYFNFDFVMNRGPGRLRESKHLYNL